MYTARFRLFPNIIDKLGAVAYAIFRKPNKEKQGHSSTRMHMDHRHEALIS
jgi:hypothetical protein